jgi:hypothetical protein
MSTPLHDHWDEAYEKGRQDMLAECLEIARNVPAETTVNGDRWQDISGVRVRHVTIDRLQALGRQS